MESKQTTESQEIIKLKKQLRDAECVLGMIDAYENWVITNELRKSIDFKRLSLSVEYKKYKKKYQKSPL